MVKVHEIGRPRWVTNPQTGDRQEMVLVTFIEESKRLGGNADLSLSSQVLDEVLGVETGLPQFRTHSQLVTPEAAGKLQVGQAFPTLHINRTLSTFPVMVQQKDAKPRIVDGRPTYFNTKLDRQPVEDKDTRIDNNIVASNYPHLFTDAQLGATIVETTDAQGQVNGDDRVAQSRQKNALGANPAPSLESSTINSQEGPREGAKQVG